MERMVSRIVLGAIAPVVLFLAGWWGTLGVAGDSALISWMALCGLACGLALDATWLRRWLDSLYSLRPAAQATIALFYAVMIYGFFMGLPVPLLLVGLGWGFAAVHGDGPSDLRVRRTRLASWGSASLMTVACLATAWLAFREPSIALQVRGMLGISFTPSVSMLHVGSLIGGVVLVGLAYTIPSILAARNAATWNQSHA